jgi:hypothetical protein
VQDLSGVAKFPDIGNSLHYKTNLGSAHLGDSLELMKEIPDESVDLICTSPPCKPRGEGGIGFYLFSLFTKKEKAQNAIAFYKSNKLSLSRIAKP